MDLTPLLRLLYQARGPTPSLALQRAVKRFHTLAVDALGAVLDHLHRDGWGTEQVIAMLGWDGSHEACTHLVRVLVGWPDDMHHRAGLALVRNGSGSISALLPALHDHPELVAPTLAQCAAGTQDPAVRSALASLIDTDLELGAACASAFQDPLLVGDLMEALASRHALEFRGCAVVEAYAAILSLDVDPGPIGRQRLAELHHHAKMMRV